MSERQRQRTVVLRECDQAKFRCRYAAASWGWHRAPTAKVRPCIPLWIQSPLTKNSCAQQKQHRVQRSQKALFLQFPQSRGLPSYSFVVQQSARCFPIRQALFGGFFTCPFPLRIRPVVQSLADGPSPGSGILPQVPASYSTGRRCEALSSWRRIFYQSFLHLYYCTVRFETSDDEQAQDALSHDCTQPSDGSGGLIGRLWLHIAGLMDLSSGTYSIISSQYPCPRRGLLMGALNFYVIFSGTAVRFGLRLPF